MGTQLAAQAANKAILFDHAQAHTIVAPMKHLLPIVLISLSLCACRKVASDSPSHEGAASTQQSAAKPEIEDALKLQIEELEAKIENSKNLISDMEAFILMERAKIEDNPDYDQSFMEEALNDQDEQREIIGEALKQIEKLKGSGQ